MSEGNVKDYYYEVIWPRIKHQDDIRTMEAAALRVYHNAGWVKEAFNALRGQPILSGKNWILEQHAREVVAWFRREPSDKSGPFLDVEKEFLQGNIFVGTFPTDELNASICFIPEAGGYLILFNSGMMNFLNEVVKIMVSFTRMGEFSPTGEFLRETKNTSFLSEAEAIAYLKEILIAFKENRSFIPQRTVVNPSKELLLLQGDIIFSIEKFILAHEFAHCVAGHVNNKSTRALAIPDSNKTLNIILKNHAQEYEADSLAAILPVLQTLPKGFDPKKNWLNVAQFREMIHVVWGPLFFFSLMELIDKVLDNVNSITHPASAQRYTKIRNLYQSLLEKRFFDLFDLYHAFLKKVQASL